MSVRDFIQGSWRPVAASLTMGGVLLLVQHYVHLDSALFSLPLGRGAAMIVYYLAFNLLPGGRSQLGFLATEFRGALRRRALAPTDE